MAKLIAQEWISLDGVAQAPSDPDEDTSGDFQHGGWHSPFFDDAAMAWVVDFVTSADSYLLGRRTYQIFAAHWPNASDDEQTLAQPLNERPKYVISSSLTESLVWNNARLLKGDIGESVLKLTTELDGDLHLIGSTELLHTLLNYGLVDELRLMIDPIILGAGKRWYPLTGARLDLRLIDSQTTSTGATLATYAR